MAPDPTSSPDAVSGTSARLLRLLVLLQRRPSWRGVELADHLGVDVRTVRRDVDRVRSLGYTVESTSGPTGGYRLGIGTDMPPLLLDEDEAMAVAVLLGVSAGASLPGVERAALVTLARVERLLPRRLQHQVKALRTAALLLVRPSEPVPATELAPLAEACAERQLVRFDYVARSGEPTTRRAEPYRLVSTIQRWYLVAFDLDRQDWRTFRVDRMTNLAVPGHTFVPRRLDDPEQLVRAALNSTPYRYRAEVLVAAPPEELSRRVAPNVGIVEPAGRSSRLRVGADNVSWLASFLIDLDLPFEVVAPPELRAKFADLGRRLAQGHQDAED